MYFPENLSVVIETQLETSFSTAEELTEVALTNV